jgi:hypothetical protein
MRHLALKIVSLALAVVLSLFVHYFFINEQSDTSVIQLIAPIQVEKLPRELAIVAPSNRQAEIALRGSSLSLSRLVTAPPVFRVEVPEGADSRFTATLRKEDLRLPSDVEVLSIRPVEVEFKLDRLVERTVPVVIPQIGRLGRGLQIVQLRSVPESVVLYGPEGELRRFASVETAPLDLRDLKESGVRVLSVRTPPGVTESRSPSVEVHIQVEEIQKELVLRSVPVEVQNGGDTKYLPRPASVRVELSGPERVLSTFDASKLVALVAPVLDSERKTASHEVSVRVELPPGLTIKRVEPAVVTLAPEADGQKAVKPRANRAQK